MQRNQLLKWKCLDNFVNVSRKQLFYGRNVAVSRYMRTALVPVLESFKEKFLQEIDTALSNHKTRLIISGGAYTFFFILPYIFKMAKRRYPLLNVEIRFEEVRDLSTLQDSGSDVVVGAYYLNPSESEDSFGNLKNTRYCASRRYYDDGIFFAASSESVARFGGKEETLKKHQLLIGRLFAETDLSAYLYNVKPVSRKEDNPRITIDSYFAAYLLMKQSMGIWHMFASADGDGIEKLHDSALITARRKIFCMQNRSRLKSYFERQIYNLLQRREK